MEPTEKRSVTRTSEIVDQAILLFDAGAEDIAMKKSTCLLTMPRSGSEVALNHIAKAYDLEIAGEFLSFHRSYITHAYQTGAIGNFHQRFNLQHIPGERFDYDSFKAYAQIEFENRLKFIHAEKRPLVVKTFMSSSFYDVNYANLSRLRNEFNVIVLIRRDSLKCILSDYICRILHEWHVYTDSDADVIREKLSSLRLTINEQYFLGVLRSINNLNYYATHQHDGKVIYFEDFENDPTVRLNELLDTKVDLDFQPSQKRFIDDHEKYIVNIDRLKFLHDQYKK